MLDRISAIFPHVHTLHLYIHNDYIFMSCLHHPGKKYCLQYILKSITGNEISVSESYYDVRNHISSLISGHTRKLVSQMCSSCVSSEYLDKACAVFQTSYFICSSKGINKVQCGQGLNIYACTRSIID